MDESAPTTTTAQDAADAARNISNLSDYEKVRGALVTDSADAQSSGDQLPFEREPMPEELERADESEAPAAEASPEGADQDETPPDPKSRQRTPKVKKAKARIDKIVWEREEARKEVAQLRQQLEALQPAATETPASRPADAASSPAPPAEASEKTTPTNPEPKEADYSEYGDFVAAKARWAAREELTEALQAVHQQQQQSEQQHRHQERAASFAKKMEEGGNGDPEFLATIQPEILNLRPAMSLQEGEAPTGATAIADLLLDSDNPHSLMAYLSSHEDDFRRISALHPMLAMRELGRIEVGLDAAPNGSAPAPVSSQAQPPIRPVGSSSARTVATHRSPSEIDSVAEWEIARKRLLHNR
jgi:hypothetical protein